MSDESSKQNTSGAQAGRDHAVGWRTAGAQLAPGQPTPPIPPTLSAPPARIARVSQAIPGPGATDPRLRGQMQPVGFPTSPPATAPTASSATPGAPAPTHAPTPVLQPTRSPIVSPARVRTYAPSLDPVRILHELRSVSPQQFEHIIGGLVTFWGYSSVQQCGGPGDLAADLLCYDARGALTVVQCKRYGPKNNVGSQTVQTFIGMITVHHHANQGLLVTSADFTRQALNLAKQHPFLILINGKQLVEHVRKWRLATGVTRYRP